jgi:hypothetical protein
MTTSTPEQRAERRRLRDTSPEGRARRRAQVDRRRLRRGLPPVPPVRPLNTRVATGMSLATRLRRIVHGTQQRLSRLSARGRTMANTITVDDVVALWHTQGGYCALSGVVLTPETGHTNTVSLDRIDNEGGYTPDNIQLLAAQVNTAKNKWSEAEFVAMCRAVAAHTAAR